MATTVADNEPAVADGAHPEVKSGAVVLRREEPAGSIAAFASQGHFESAQRMAKALASSTMVPEDYRGPDGVANCLVAMELASRTGASVLMVMQNMFVIHGRPGWSATFLIASVNSCGRFTPLRFQFEGTEKQNGWRCRAVAREKATGDLLEGEWITWEMVNAEGWTSKTGSKWRTMPGQMMRYRAASFWTRTYCPEISLGMHSADEIEDMSEPRSDAPSPAAQRLNSALARVVAQEAEATKVEGAAEATTATEPESAEPRRAAPVAEAPAPSPTKKKDRDNAQLPFAAPAAGFPCPDCGATKLPHRAGCRA